jgi:hypothetical protein
MAGRQHPPEVDTPRFLEMYSPRGRKKTNFENVPIMPWQTN